MFRFRSIAFLLLFSPLVLAVTAAAQGLQTVTVKVPAPVFLTPGETTQPLRVAKAGSVLRLLGSEGDWYHIEFDDPQYGRRVGFVRKSLVVLNAPDYSRIAPVDLSVHDQPRDREPVEATPRAEQGLPGRALEEGGIRQGTTELMFSGKVTGVNAGGSDTIALASATATVGYFATPHLEFGADFSVVKASGVDPAGTVGGVFAYNFNPEAPMVGFAGGEAGGGFGAGEANPFFFQLFAGLRVLTPGRGGAFIVRPYYARASSQGISANEFGVALGISILF